jgi:uncharacterized membrane protein
MKKIAGIFVFILLLGIFIFSCSKGGGDDNTPPANPCANVTINLTVTPADATTCQSNGSITANATGSSGFTYSINGTTFQSSGDFTNLAAGAFTVTVKDAKGCTKTANATIASTGTAGPLFGAVKALMQANCQSCHNNTTANGGKNWTLDCNIVSSKDRIQARAVDLGTMPPTGALPQSEKDKITAWINAGGRFTD